MRNLQIEALFGGVLALAVLAIAIFAVSNATFTGASGASADDTGIILTKTDSDRDHYLEFEGEDQPDLVCECYNKAFSLAGRDRVVSPDYRNGFEQCRARAGVDGGAAWTAGWTARTEGNAYESSCRAYKRGLF